MKKRRSVSSAQGVLRRKKRKRITDSDIDFSDIPELSDQQLASARRVGRPKSDNPKHLIAIRISPRLLSDLRRIAKKRGTAYQTLMHQLLEKAVRHAA